MKTAAPTIEGSCFHRASAQSGRQQWWHALQVRTLVEWYWVDGRGWVIFPSSSISIFNSKAILCHFNSLLVNLGHLYFTSTIKTSTLPVKLLAVQQRWSQGGGGRATGPQGGEGPQMPKRGSQHILCPLPNTMWSISSKVGFFWAF